MKITVAHLSSQAPQILNYVPWNCNVSVQIISHSCVVSEIKAGSLIATPANGGRMEKMYQLWTFVSAA